MRENNKKILTVSELKKMLENWPDENDNGEATQVWIDTAETFDRGVFNVYKSTGSDIIFEA